VIYAVLGGVLGVLAGPLLGVAADGLWVTGLIGAVGVYLLSCLLFPFTLCWRCKGRRRRDDGQGNWRDRDCAVCGGDPYPRFGARLMGRHR
jgi:hypothetical protein